jgi:hypothetical protein
MESIRTVLVCGLFLIPALPGAAQTPPGHLQQRPVYSAAQSAESTPTSIRLGNADHLQLSDAESRRVVAGIS